MSEETASRSMCSSVHIATFHGEVTRHPRWRTVLVLGCGMHRSSSTGAPAALWSVLGVRRHAKSAQTLVHQSVTNSSAGLPRLNPPHSPSLLVRCPGKSPAGLLPLLPALSSGTSDSTGVGCVVPSWPPLGVSASVSHQFPESHSGTSSGPLRVK